MNLQQNLFVDAMFAAMMLVGFLLDMDVGVFVQ